MQTLVEINNKTNALISQSIVSEILVKTIELSDFSCLLKKDVQLSIAVVEAREIQEINNKYRKKDSPTDVLSFADYEDPREICNDKSQTIFLGELILCPEIIEQCLHDSNFSKENEYVYIVSHGILHLLGYDHGELMYGIQDKVVAQLS